MQGIDHDEEKACTACKEILKIKCNVFSGTVGTWQREQVELFCISRLLNVVLENDEEFVYMDCSCPVGQLQYWPLLLAHIRSAVWNLCFLHQGLQFRLAPYTPAWTRILQTFHFTFRACPVDKFV